VSLQRQSYTTQVSAGPDACFAVITDFGAYPRWSGAVRRTQVHERYPDGLAKRVEMELDIKIRRIRYTLEYTYTPPTHLTWRLVEGDLKAVEGSYDFAEVAPGRTAVTCTQGVDIGFWIPGFLRSIFEQQALRESVEEFKRAVETDRGRS
jgi:ribosome-associated toxin RatA of RatAB toxin-antitoxin module